MRRFLLLLALLAVACPDPAFAQYSSAAWPGPPYPERGGEGGGATAPGIVGNTASLETFKWMWGLSDVPFPSVIEPTDGWTNVYCSATSAGNWAVGDDGNGGTSPEDAQATLSTCLATALAQPYGRVVLDHETFCVDLYSAAGDEYTDTNPGTETYQFVASTNTLTRSSGSFVTDDFHPGQIVTATGTASNNGNFLVTGVSALTLTFSSNSDDVTNEGPTLSNAGPFALSINNAQAQGSPDGLCDFDGTTAGGGYGDGLGTIQDADVTLDGETTSQSVTLEQPYWWIWCPPGGSCTIDQRSYAGGPETDAGACLTWAVSTKRSQLLLSGSLNITCEYRVPLDAKFEGWVRYVGDGTLQSTGVIGGTSNIVSAHDLTVVDAYGDFTLNWLSPTITDASSSSPTVGTNGAGHIGIHTTNDVKSLPLPNASLVTVGQSGANKGSLSPEQLARIAVTPSRIFTSGFLLETLEDNTSDSRATVDLGPAGGTNEANWVEYLSLSNAFRNMSEGDFALAFSLTETHAGSLTRTRLLYPTIQSMTSASARYFLIPGGFSATSVWDIHVAGYIMEESGGELKAGTGSSFANQFLRLLGTGGEAWANGDSVFRLVDGIYRSGRTDAFYVGVTGAAGDICTDDDLPGLAACVNAQSPGTLEVVNSLSLTSALIGRNATGASTATNVVDGAGGLTADAHVGGILFTTAGTGSLQARRITANNANSFTVTPALDVVPDATTDFNVTLYADSEGRCQIERTPDCEDHITGGASDYAATLAQQQYCPAYICGVTVQRVQADPGVQNDAGRQRPDPWAPR